MPAPNTKNTVLAPTKVAAKRAKARDRDTTLSSILQAATAVFAQYGLRAARTDDIAARAGVTRGLLFHYFPSKEHLFEAVLQRAYEPLREVLNDKALQSGPPQDALRLLVERLLAAMTACPHGPAIFLMESIQNHGEHYKKLGMPSIYRALEDVLRRGVNQGAFRKLNAYHAAINIMGLCSYYFCATNNFLSEQGVKDPLSARALSRHTREVLGFVRAATMRDHMMAD